MNELFAHSTRRSEQSDWEPLDVHLRSVAARAAAFASSFGAAEFGRLAGLWHDLGKYLPEFQRRIRGEMIRVDHAGPGAVAASADRNGGLPLAFAIAGHHAGLANATAQGDTDQRPLFERLRASGGDWKRIESAIPPGFWPQPVPNLPFPVRTADEKRTLELWTRFLFSALVDADYLETERFYDKPRFECRGRYDSVAELKTLLDAYLETFCIDSPVNRVRAEILADCRRAAEQLPGLFSLTVPTGGGKTLSGLAFALDHAVRHGLHRVVVAIPYTSIIEQTADVYRRILGEANVVEHHSNIDTQKREEQNAEIEQNRRLAAENWDAPIVVTTNVQLLESLLANQPSRCRKLHNLARAVIVLDEAQCLPLDMATTVVELLGELATRYGSTIVLSTATQPALNERESFPQGLKQVREIVTDSASLAARLRRVRIRWPADPQTKPADYEAVAREIAARPRVLAIVHKRVDARTLAKLLPDDGLYHLSALMCPAHRRRVLAEVRERLKRDDGSPLRLVATQLVEAGVDVDFPVVYRALAGLDSVAQAAGRCDREGRLTAEAGRPAGEVVVFRAPTDPPPGYLRQALDSTLGLLDELGGDFDLFDPRIIDKYFRRLALKITERPDLFAARTELNFATVAAKSRIIDEDASTPLVVPYRDRQVDGEAAIAAFRREVNADTLRALQPFLVQIREQDRTRLSELGGLDPLMPEGNLSLLGPLCARLYDDRYGLVLDDESRNDPAAMVV